MFDLYVHGGTSLINAVLALLDLLMIAFLVWFIKPGYGMATKTHIRSARIILLSFAILSLLTSWSIFLVQLDGDVMRFTIGFLAMTLRFSILLLGLVWAWDAIEESPAFSDADRPSTPGRKETRAWKFFHVRGGLLSLSIASINSARPSRSRTPTASFLAKVICRSS